VQGAECRVQGAGCRVQGPRRVCEGLREGLEFRVQGSVCRVKGRTAFWAVSSIPDSPRFRVQGAGCRVQSAGFREQSAGCRVQGARCRVQGARCRVQGVCFRVFVPPLSVTSRLNSRPFHHPYLPTNTLQRWRSPYC
jgi:hypothetical protein